MTQPANDARIVMTLDAGGTSFQFSAIRGNQAVIVPFPVPSNGDRRDAYLATPQYQHQDKDDDPEGPQIQIRSGPHTFIAKTIEGHYPNYRNVIPCYMPQSVTVPETHRSALIAWLRSLTGKSNSVRLT
jgi:hypothetical protein